MSAASRPMGRPGEHGGHQAGIILATERLAASWQRAPGKFSGDKRIVIDAPFTETKELVSGLAATHVTSLEEAIDRVTRAPSADIAKLTIK